MESSRRQNAAEALGCTTVQEKKEQQIAIEKEIERQNRKQQKKNKLENELGYQVVRGVKKIMDDWYLDPIIGFLIPGVGDVLSSVCAIPFIYVSLFKVKSIPLTLACIYNTLIDMILGLIPFGIGAVIDIFKKSYKKNYRLIVGFVEDDKDIISQVNRTAFKATILIAIFCVIIYYMVKWTIAIGSFMYNFIAGLFT